MTVLLHKGSAMSVSVSRGGVLLAGVTTAAAAVAVVGHMYAIDWFGKKLRETSGRRRAAKASPARDDRRVKEGR